MYIAGLDIGTSGSKITVYDEKGNFIENHYMPYDSIHKDGCHEIDANLIADAIKTVISETEHIPEALGITSFGESFVLVDEDGNALTNAFLYTDTRADISAFDAEETKRIAGCLPNGMYSLPKLVWIKNNMPDVYSKAKHILLMQDYAGFFLCGKACIDYSLAARTMGFDVKERKWSKELFDKAGIDMSLMSEPVQCGTVIGVSDKFGLKNTKIVIGCHDQVASAIGAGALDSGLAVDGSGSVECVTPIFDGIPDNLVLCDMGYPFVPFLDGKFVSYSLIFNGGTALKWYRDNFAKGIEYKELDGLVSNKPTGILVLPHFSGSATPYMDSESKAVFAGVALEHTSSDFYKAVMEGVAYEMLINSETLAKYGIKPKKLLATGGGSKSPVWLQIKADVLNTPITVVDAPEVGTMGTIMLTAVAVGAYSSLEDAMENFVRYGKTYYPSEEMHKAYMVHYEKYKKLYEASKEFR